MRVAAVQITTSLVPAENRLSVTNCVDAAAAAGASLVVFPEATMCSFGPPSFDLSAVAEPLDGPFVDTLGRAADAHGVTVVAGMFEVAPEHGRVHNTVVVVGPGGIVGAYRKVHLFDALGARESDRVTAGDAAAGPVTFDAGGLVFGVMTCYDLRFPESARALVDAGATAIVLPAHWYAGPGKLDVWDALVRARAIESTAYVVAACKPGPECVGHSVVVDPLGAVLCELEGTGGGLATAELDPERVGDARRVLPVLEHRRFSVRPGRPAAPAEPL